MDMRLALLGCGHVGRAFVALAAEKEHELRARCGLELRFTGGLTRSAGGWTAARGLSARELAEADWPRSPSVPGATAFAGDGAAFAAACPTDIVVELTTLQPTTGEPAIGHVRAALAAGRHVVTANKGPLAHAYRSLRALARERGVALRFESTVMDGTPIFNLARFCLPVTRVESLRGPLNSTSNYVLGRMAGGADLEAALADARERGIAEADPRYDLEGWDAAVKATVLAVALMDAELRPGDVAREGLGAAAMRAAAAGLRTGHAPKQVAEVARAPDGGVTAAVRLVALPPDDPLAHLRPGETGLTLRTDTMGELTLIEGDGGPGQTAFGVLADVVAIAEERR